MKQSTFITPYRCVLCTFSNHDVFIEYEFFSSSQI